MKSELQVFVQTHNSIKIQTFVVHVSFPRFLHMKQQKKDVWKLDSIVIGLPIRLLQGKNLIMNRFSQGKLDSIVIVLSGFGSSREKH